MSGMKIPDDIERWEKKGLREDIDTDAEHVHDIYVWKDLAVEHETMDCIEHDRGHWNPYVIVNGHPVKLAKDYFDSFEEAVGYLKAAMKDKELVCEGADEKDDDLDIPKHPEGDVVVRKGFSMSDRIAFMNGTLAKAEGDPLVREDYFEKLKKENPPKFPPKESSDEASDEAPGATPEREVNLDSPSETYGKDINRKSRETPKGATPQLPTAYPLGHDNTGNPTPPAPAGKTQNLGRMLSGARYHDYKAVQDEPSARKDWTMRFGNDDLPTSGSSKFATNSLPRYSIYSQMLKEYDDLARRNKSDLLPIFDENHEYGPEDLMDVSSNQLRNAIIQTYKVKDPLTGELTSPRELKSVPVFGGWQLGKLDENGKPLPIFIDDKGTLNRGIMSMLMNDSDEFNGQGLLRNAKGIVPFKIGGSHGQRPQIDVYRRESEMSHVKPRDRMVPTNMIQAALAQAVNEIGEAYGDDDAEGKIQQMIDDKLHNSEMTEDVMNAMLKPYMADENGSPRTPEQAQRMWALDRLKDERDDKAIGMIEPALVEWMDNMPLRSLVELFDEYPVLRRNMAMSPADRRNWYRNAFGLGKLRNADYSGDAIDAMRRYMGLGGSDGFDSRSIGERRDDMDNELGQPTAALPGSKSTRISNRRTISEEDAKTMQDLAKRKGGNNIIRRTQRQKDDDLDEIKHRRKNQSMRDRIAYYDPLFDTSMSKGDDEGDEKKVEGGIPDGKTDTEPRIARFRTVTIGEGKDSVFPMRIVDKTTGKTLVLWDGKI